MEWKLKVIPDVSWLFLLYQQFCQWALLFCGPLVVSLPELYRLACGLGLLTDQLDTSKLLSAEASTSSAIIVVANDSIVTTKTGTPSVSSASLIQRRCPYAKRKNLPRRIHRVNNSEDSFIVPRIPRHRFLSATLHPVYQLDEQLTEEVKQLYSANFGGPDECSDDEIIERIKDGNYRLFILTHKDLHEKTVAGMVITATYSNSRFIHIEYLVVSSAIRGQGLGNILLKLLFAGLENEVQLDESAPSMLTLECEKRLIPFYQKAGARDSELEPEEFVHVQTNAQQEEQEICPYYFLYKPLVENMPFFTKAHFANIRNCLRAQVHDIDDYDM